MVTIRTCPPTFEYRCLLDIVKSGHWYINEKGNCLVYVTQGNCIMFSDGSSRPEARELGSMMALYKECAVDVALTIS